MCSSDLRISLTIKMAVLIDLHLNAPNSIRSTGYFSIPSALRTRNQSTERIVRKSKQHRPRIPVPILVNGFPPLMKVDLHYESLVTLMPGAAVASYVFRGNSLFDPDYTGTGHQPRYYDQLTPIYGRYKVLRSAITVEMINGSPNSGAIFAITPNTEGLS